VDVAARELEPFENFAVDAGGDLYLGGHNAEGEPWSVGVRHPREQSLIETMRVSNMAVLLWTRAPEKPRRNSRA
jgi:thiamine biosynthesis lipoprotein